MIKNKHFFVINPKAGKTDISKKISSDINKIFKNSPEEYSIYITKNKNDATIYTRNICESQEGNLRFYACGGDGTLNEVINGIIGYENASISVIPYGTGNDFVKNFQSQIGFYDINKQIKSKLQEVDLLNVNGQYSINLCNIGFDAKVAENMIKFKKIPLISGQGAYTLSVFYSLINKMCTNLEIEIDDCEIINGDFLLCVIANGKSYGGGYLGAPLAEIDDGLIDLCIVRKISRLKLVNLMKLYKEGRHLESEELKDYIIYKKCNSIKIKSKENFTICLDGEITTSNNLNVSLKNKGVKFITPYKEIDE